MIEVELPDGTIAEFPDGTPRETIEKALQSRFQSETADPRNPDGTYGDPPEGMVLNPYTGQMTERALLEGSIAQRPNEGVATSAARGVGRGVTFGGVDELSGAVSAAIPGPGTAKERYDFGREYVRAAEGAAESRNPTAFPIGEIGGGMSAALGYGMPAMASRGMGGAMAGGSLVGGAEGLTYGALTGEGGKDRFKRAAQFGTAGAALGGAIPRVTASGKKLYDMGRDVVGGGVDAVRGRASAERANRAIAKTLMKSGKTVDEVGDALSTAAREGQPEYRAMDALGIAGQRRASSIARSGGDSAAEIADYLNQRQLDQPERVGAFVEDAFDLAGTSSNKTRRALTEGRDMAADINFGDIRASNQPVDIRGAIQEIDSRVQPFINADIDSPARKALANLRAQLAGKKGDASYELSDFSKVFAIRKQLRDDISEAFRAGRNELASDLRAVRQSLDDALAASNPSYKQAMDEFAASSRVIDAAEAGGMMARPGRRAIDTTEEFARMSPDEQAAARVGYGDKILTKVEASAGGANRARPLTSTKASQEASAMAVDPNLYQRRVGREMDMFETRNIAVGGSRTADNLEDIQELQGADVGPIISALRGDLKGAALTTGQRGINVATGMNDSTRQLIARALMSGSSDQIQTAVSQVQASKASEMAKKAIIDTLIRSAAVRNSEGLQAVVGRLVQ